MKHTIKVTVFVEVDMDHETYPKDRTRDIDAYIELARAEFNPHFDSDDIVVEGALFTGCQVELVE